MEALWSESTEYKVCEPTSNWSTYTVRHARNAWYIHRALAIRITTAEGHTTERPLRPYPAIRTGNWMSPAGGQAPYNVAPEAVHLNSLPLPYVRTRAARP